MAGSSKHHLSDTYSSISLRNATLGSVSACGNPKAIGLLSCDGSRRQTSVCTANVNFHRASGSSLRRIYYSLHFLYQELNYA